MTNVLKIRAAKKNFSPTSLHAFTQDGKVYAFEITYAEHPLSFTYDLRKLDQKEKPLLLLEDKISDDELRHEVELVKVSKPFFGRSVHRNGIKLQLRSIFISGDRLLFDFEISNKSNLSLDIDFVRTFMQDQQKVKRSSFQDYEMIPLFKDSLRTVPGHSKSQFVIVMPKFTLSGQKQFRIELFEKNEGRNLSIQTKNRELLKSVNL